MAGIVARGFDADDQPRIGVALVARILAHAVDREAAGFRRRGDDRAAGAHAEAVDRSTVAAVVREAVGRGAQIGMTRTRTEPRPVDPGLRMFDADADREGLRLDIDAARVQRMKRVAGAVSDRQNDMIGRDDSRRRADATPRSRAVLARLDDVEVDDVLLEPVFAAEVLDLRGEDSRRLWTRRKVPMCGCASTRISAGAPACDEFGQHLAAQMARILDLAPELPVRERAGAAFAELNVRFGMQDALAPQAPRCPSSAREPPCRDRGSIGRRPTSARISAANSPHGPAPMTTGRAGCGAWRRSIDRSIARVGGRSHARVLRMSP